MTLKPPKMKVYMIRDSEDDEELSHLPSYPHAHSSLPQLLIPFLPQLLIPFLPHPLFLVLLTLSLLCLLFLTLQLTQRNRFPPYVTMRNTPPARRRGREGSQCCYEIIKATFIAVEAPGTLSTPRAMTSASTLPSVSVDEDAEMDYGLSDIDPDLLNQLTDMENSASKEVASIDN
ncbi:hypothetical protein BDZ97DRAFT_1921428 [Flammula alnicola]|nr:hypothetical protein BDZ97DRAFT_1921428 [Flammula alnicola]